MSITIFQGSLHSCRGLRLGCQYSHGSSQASQVPGIQCHQLACSGTRQAELLHTESTKKKMCTYICAHEISLKKFLETVFLCLTLAVLELTLCYEYVQVWTFGRSCGGWGTNGGWKTETCRHWLLWKGYWEKGGERGRKRKRQRQTVTFSLRGMAERERKWTEFAS